jgi:flagella basal body P-ring formation protein FlgA
MRRHALLLSLALLALPAAARAAADDVAGAVAQALAERWPDLADRAEVRVVRLSGGSADAAPPLRARFLDDAPPRGRASAEILHRDASGAWQRAGWALLDVAWFDTVAVLTRDLARGDALAPADLRLERRDVTALTDVPLSPDTLATQAWTAARALRAGTPLTRRLLAPPAAAERGDPVRIHYARGSIRMLLDGEARERGAVGETIRVYTSTTRSLQRVRLTAPGEGVWVGR